jgi:hypothetical protein
VARNASCCEHNADNSYSVKCRQLDSVWLICSESRKKRQEREDFGGAPTRRMPSLLWLLGGLQLRRWSRHACLNMNIPTFWQVAPILVTVVSFCYYYERHSVVTYCLSYFSIVDRLIILAY